MGRLGTISVGMELDATHFGSGLSKVSTEVRTFSGDVDRMGGALRGALAIGGLAYGGAKVGGWLMDVSRMAADAEDSINALTITFGDQAGKVEGFARDMASAYHLGLNKVLDTQNQFGSMFQGAGFDEKSIAAMTEGMTRIALDQTRLRSGFTFEEMKRKFLSGLAGEQEPLKAIGLGFNEAVVKAQARKMGMGDGKGDLTEQQKVLARYAYFVERSQVAMGTAAREADNLAARISGITGAWEDMQLMVGQMVAPTIAAFMEDMTIGLQVGVKMWNENSAASSSWFTSLTADLGVATSGMGLFAESMGMVADAAFEMRGTFKVVQRGMNDFLGDAAGAMAPFFGGDNPDGMGAGLGGVGRWMKLFSEEVELKVAEMNKDVNKLAAQPMPSKLIAERWKEIEAENEKKRQALASKPIEIPDPILGGEDEAKKKAKKVKAASPYASTMLADSRDAAETLIRSTYGRATAREAEKTAANTGKTVDVLQRIDEKLGGFLTRVAEGGGAVDWS